MLQNKDAYKLADVAAGYARQTHLHPPEETILRLLLPRLPSAKMLDLGVGGGRTTLHFAKWVQDYVGADYSESMIAECEKRFVGYPGPLSFRVCDARSMEMFATGSFDFILFSHNGIDYVSHEDRLKILKEIRRVGKPGSYFCFSSHNLNWAVNLFELRRLVSFNPKAMVRTMKRLGLRFGYNSNIRVSDVKQAPYLMLNDGAHGRKLLTYYVRPSEQIRQLQEDFVNIRVFSEFTGVEVGDPSQLQTIEDTALCYLCQVKSQD